MWAENSIPSFPIGDASLSATAVRMIARASAGGKTLEPQAKPVSVPNMGGPSLPPTVVINDGLRRHMVFVNDGTNPTDSTNTVPSVPIAVTVNIAAWNLPVGTVLVRNLAAAGSFGETAQLITTTGNSITFTVPAYSTNQIIAPVVPQTVSSIMPFHDTTIKAGANVGNNYGSASTLTVSTSNTAVHDNTAVTMIKFNVPAASSSSVLTSVLSLTVAAAPANDMVMTIFGLSCTYPSGLSWSEETATWSTSNFVTTVPSGQITAIYQQFTHLNNLGQGNTVVGHVTVAAGTQVGTVKMVDVTEYVNACAGGPATLVISRRMRYNAATGNAGGALAADDLSQGASVAFYSKEATTGGPSLTLMSGPVAPAPPPSMYLTAPAPTSTPPPPPAVMPSPTPSPSPMASPSPTAPLPTQTLSYTASTVAAPYTTPMTIGVNQASSLTHTRSLSAGVYSVRATAASKSIVYES